ncbi:WbqC family protein [Vreelandella nigrificans]|uniref:Glycine transferase n=1 Tax=Vreelandella nigrificans TaxID=2042704 RepID=A0A2A4HNW8_9GAMM|nr:WbqC family protein [Halomonas nigrificans]PCF96490.1 hypothetical protein CPA45_05560 [Halomonas nigrificans]
MLIADDSIMVTEKKIAIMQPYFFPYLGYFQLIAASDFFIFLDDVQYIKRGWINKNKINTKHGEVFFTIPIKKASLENKINETLCTDLLIWKKKFFKTLEINYSSKKHDMNFLYFLKENLIPQTQIEPTISDISIHSIELVLRYLDIEFNYEKSSNIDKDSEKKGTERIISIVKKNQGTKYINLPGGKDIYKKSLFKHNGLGLNFIDPSAAKTTTSNEIKNASIIDTIMLFGKEKPRELILNYSLTEA